MVNVVSTFSGCGGSSLGYILAGCKILLALDFEENAVKTYKLNFPNTLVWKSNIRDITGEKILNEIKLKVGELDIFDGSPPCNSFSMAGKREDGWNKSYKHSSESHIQRTDDLFFEYLRLIGEIQPKIFVAENVRGLISGVAKGYFNMILKTMKLLGYNVKVFDINAKDFDVPQSRPRIIFIGVRNDIFKEWKLLKTHKEISFNTACIGLKIPDSELQFAKRIENHTSMQYIKLLKQGETASKYHPKGSYFNISRINEDKPVRTILAKCSLIHPRENREITLSECKRLSSFPDDFKFLSIHDGILRIGNSVPPNLMYHIANYVKNILNMTI